MSKFLEFYYFVIIICGIFEKVFAHANTFNFLNRFSTIIIVNCDNSKANTKVKVYFDCFKKIYDILAQLRNVYVLHLRFL